MHKMQKEEAIFKAGKLHHLILNNQHESKGSKTQSKKHTIKWRSHEPSRIETFSDAVFAFALTLVIISFEVPKSFDEYDGHTMRGPLALLFALRYILYMEHPKHFF
jgi:hypothetical protein